jgi:hypothetical protein
VKRMRALGRHGPGIVPKQFKLLLLDEREDYMWPSFGHWVDRASAGDIVAAYEVCRNPHARYHLCREAGRRGLHAALPMLVHALNDPDSSVRNEAAQALCKIGDPSTGYDLFKRYAAEREPAMRHWLALGLGSTGYRPAVPLLTNALADADPMSRACAAEALAALGVTEALPALQQALAREADVKLRSWPSIGCAIDKLEAG